ncbi:hypothetical protein [Gordonia polyisoprenivorans]|uniref:hypothetical protein n=1 Tax=Gordonia polyisoprenivorans TaxID=84595 RepID=UPI002300AB0B|nr:hypothetical protein [Gordonia polyisoprenivorans]WCB38026.1 hypothetical protein PHA63_02370 [Gordonia polyisoprenivorans]
MTDQNGELAQVLDGASSAVCDALPGAVRAEVSAAARDHRRALTIAVTGRPGTGRDTMTRAVRERLRVGALGPGEDHDAIDGADLWVHVIVAAVRPADHEILASLPVERTIVVLGKADTHPDPRDAAHAAADAARILGRPVTAVSALLACADVTEAEWTFLADLVARDEQMPSMAGHFLVGDPGGRERTLRRGLLRRLDRFGIETALDLMGAGVVADADGLNATLHRLSGIEALVPTVAACVGAVRARREGVVRDRLEGLAVAGVAREGIEQLLRVPEVVR